MATSGTVLKGEVRILLSYAGRMSGIKTFRVWRVSKKQMQTCCLSWNSSSNGDGLKGQIPDTSDQFLKRISSMSAGIHAEQNNYDVVDSNPYEQEHERPLFVIAENENKVFTVRIRRPQSDAEVELGRLLTQKNKKKETLYSSLSGMAKIQIEDIRNGILVFEEEEEAAEYCSVLENNGENCAGVAQMPAEQVFAMCHQSKALAVLFRAGSTPPPPKRLQRTLSAKKRSLEDC